MASYHVTNGEIDDRLLFNLNSGIYLTIEQQRELHSYGDVCLNDISSTDVSKWFNKKIKSVIIVLGHSENTIYLDKDQELHVYCVSCAKTKTVKIGISDGDTCTPEDNVISVKSGYYTIVKSCSDLCVYTGIDDTATGFTKSIIIVFEK